MQVAWSSLYVCCILLLARQIPVSSSLQLSRSLNISGTAIEAQVYLQFACKLGRILVSIKEVVRVPAVNMTKADMICAMQLKELSTLSDDPAPSVTRILFTQNDVLARR